MDSRGDVPVGVRRKALALGPVGERWLDDLDATLDGIEADWGCRIGAPIAGGTSAYVAPAVTADGTDVVMKVAIPDGLEGNSDFES